jgi:ubiquinone/menaquinone biosynthesis C-methylase UbiE
MTLSLSQWHNRYQHQAHWTQNLRHYIYERARVRTAKRVLDVGCGTGVLEKELENYTSSKVFGLDINLDHISLAKINAPITCYTLGDAYYLPYQAKSFDVTLCHFLLLWINNPIHALFEMVRVTNPGGVVIALAEPDYGGRIDYPLDLAQLGLWQKEALVRQGANPLIGRELRMLFNKADLGEVEVGLLGGQWENQSDADDFEIEWAVLHSDLNQNNDFIERENELKTRENSARNSLERILFVPTFYAWGRVK